MNTPSDRLTALSRLESAVTHAESKLQVTVFFNAA